MGCIFKKLAFIPKMVLFFHPQIFHFALSGCFCMNGKAPIPEWGEIMSKRESIISFLECTVKKRWNMPLRVPWRSASLRPPLSTPFAFSAFQLTSSLSWNRRSVYSCFNFSDGIFYNTTGMSSHHKIKKYKSLEKTVK